MSGAFELVPRGTFSLAEAARFGFGPREPEDDGVMRLAFARDDFAGHAGVALTQGRDGAVHGELQGGGDAGAVAAQVARMLSLDHDGGEWVAVGERDPVIGRLQDALPGLRPVLFPSPYEAAAWAIISARRGRGPGNAMRARIAAALGETFTLAGEEVAAFPTPERLRAVEPVPGLPPQRVERLRAVAGAALAGDLDPARLAAMEPDAAMAAMRELPGIGPFYAALIVVRAAGLADVLPVAEERSRAAAARRYELPAPLDDAGFAALAEAWRPFRTWASVLLRVAEERGV